MATFSFFKCGPSGGTGGTHFDDFRDEVPAAGIAVAKIHVNHGDTDHVAGPGKYLNSIQLTYTGHSHHTDQHGLDGGDTSTTEKIDLAGQEYIVEVSGLYGSYIDQLNIRTSRNRDLGPFGGNGGDHTRKFSYQVPDGMAIIGFFGSSGACVDALGI